MSFPFISLDEVPEERLKAELNRRWHLRFEGKCDYCERVPGTPPCRFPERHHPSFLPPPGPRETWRAKSDRLQAALEKSPKTPRARARKKSAKKASRPSETTFRPCGRCDLCLQGDSRRCRGLVLDLTSGGLCNWNDS